MGDPPSRVAKRQLWTTRAAFIEQVRRAFKAFLTHEASREAAGFKANLSASASPDALLRSLARTGLFYCQLGGKETGSLGNFFAVWPPAPALISGDAVDA